MDRDNNDIIQYNKDIVVDIFRKKDAFHRAQAKLPIEEKIKIVIELQKMALTIRPKQNENDRRMVWQI